MTTLVLAVLLSTIWTQSGVLKRSRRDKLV